MRPNIRTQAPPSLELPKLNIFDKGDFESVLWENSYDILWEKAVRCPCKGASPDNKPSCNNCHGLGWVFIDPVKTKAFIQSINKNTKYKDWSPELVGTISITLRDVNRVSLMDKVTLERNFSVMSEVLRVRSSGVNKFVFTTYRPKLIKYAMFYTGDNDYLTRLTDGDLVISRNNEFVILIRPDKIPVNSNGFISLYYEHQISYNVIDIPHDMRITKEYDSSGKKTSLDMPIQAIARKSQYELGVPSNIDGDNMLDNNSMFIESPNSDFSNDFSNDFTTGVDVITPETNNKDFGSDFNKDYK